MQVEFYNTLTVLLYRLFKIADGRHHRISQWLSHYFWRESREFLYWWHIFAGRLIQWKSLEQNSCQTGGEITSVKGLRRLVIMTVNRFFLNTPFPRSVNRKWRLTRQLSEQFGYIRSSQMLSDRIDRNGKWIPFFLKFPMTLFTINPKWFWWQFSYIAETCHPFNPLLRFIVAEGYPILL